MGGGSAETTVRDAPCVCGHAACDPVRPLTRLHLGWLRRTPFPGSEPVQSIRAHLKRTSRSVGCPTAAVMRRTWRFMPSVMNSSSQQSGTLFRIGRAGFAPTVHPGARCVGFAQGASVRP